MTRGSVAEPAELSFKYSNAESTVVIADGKVLPLKCTYVAYMLSKFEYRVSNAS